MLKNKATSENVYSQHKSLTVEIIPYVYKAGDDESYSRHPIEPVQRRRSLRLAAQKAKAPDSVQSYKSIIRTRAQKIKEHQAYLDTMFTNIDSFYKTNGYEPSPFAGTVEVVEMGKFIMALRNSYTHERLGGQNNVDLVMMYLPWFKFEQHQAVTQWSKRSFHVRDIIFMALVVVAFPAVMLLGQYILDKCYLSDQCPVWATDVYMSANNFASVTASQLSTAMTQLSTTIQSFENPFLTIV